MINKKKFSLSGLDLSYKILGIVSLTIILAISILAFLSVNFLEKSMINARKESFTRFADFIARSSAFHIENSSFYMMDQDSILYQSGTDKNPSDILSVIVCDKDGQKLNPSGIPHSKILVSPKYCLTVERTCYYKPLQEKLRAVGKVVIVFSLEAVYKKVANIREMVIFSGIAITILLVVILYWVVSISLARPLKQLRKAMENLADDQKEAEIVDYPSHDEIGEIFQVFKQVAGTLKERCRLVNHKNTDLEKSRDELKRKCGELENNIKKQNRELEVTRHAADFAGRIKNQFLSNMSHEIRTPLAGIMGMTHLLEDTDLSDKQKEYLKHLKKSGLMLSSIVGDILDISRIESGRWRIEEKSFSLRELVDHTLMSLEPAAREKGLHISYNINPSVPPILVGDEKGVTQILSNITANAVKFTNNGYIRITIEMASRQQEVIFVAFVISDTGIGIPEDRIDDIFKQFTQLDGSFTKQYSGTGLGLTIVKSLVEILSGTIKVESKPGEGSRFIVELPFKEHVAGQTHTPFQDVIYETTPVPQLPRNNYRILIAEDNEINLFFLENFLVKNGFKVQGATNGKEVLEKLETGDYDLVIMDMKMPVMNGIKCTEAIREKEKIGGGHIKIIALTGLTMDEDKDRIEAAGVDDFISKPVNEILLLKKIKLMLG